MLVQNVWHSGDLLLPFVWPEGSVWHQFGPSGTQLSLAEGWCCSHGMCADRHQVYPPVSASLRCNQSTFHQTATAEFNFSLFFNVGCSMESRNVWSWRQEAGLAKPFYFTAVTYKLRHLRFSQRLVAALPTFRRIVWPSYSRICSPLQ